jgi:hypothetical protein
MTELVEEFDEENNLYSCVDALGDGRRIHY